MPESLPITIDGPKLYEVPDRLETTGGFVVGVDNLGRATHVHLTLDGELAEVTAIPEPNQFVDSEGTLEVPVTVEGASRPITGVLTVATGYGADETRIPITIEEKSPTPTDPPPAGATGRETPSLPLPLSLDRESLVLAAIAFGAIVLAGTAVLVTGDLVVLLGALLVIGAVTVGAIYLVLGVE